VKEIVHIPLARPRDKMHSNFLHLHKTLFHLLKEELESSIIHRGPHKTAGPSEPMPLPAQESASEEQVEAVAT
jgi:hypothetical protein